MGQSNVAAGRTQSGTPYKYHGQVIQVVSISSIHFENIDFLAHALTSHLSLSHPQCSFLRFLRSSWPTARRRLSPWMKPGWTSFADAGKLARNAGKDKNH